MNREEHILELYIRTYPAVAAFVRKMGGSQEEAKDIFQEALLTYYEKKQSGGFEPEHNEHVYINGIARHMWYKHYKAAKNTSPLSTEMEAVITEEKEPSVSAHLLKFLERSGKKCMDLLSAFYYEQATMKEIARRFGFSGERSATAQKFKCLEKVRGAVQEHSLSKADFYV